MAKDSGINPPTYGAFEPTADNTFNAQDGKSFGRGGVFLDTVKAENILIKGYEVFGMGMHIDRRPFEVFVVDPDTGTQTSLGRFDNGAISGIWGLDDNGQPVQAYQGIQQGPNQFAYKNMLDSSKDVFLNQGTADVNLVYNKQDNTQLAGSKLQGDAGSELNKKTQIFETKKKLT